MQEGKLLLGRHYTYIYFYMPALQDAHFRADFSSTIDSLFLFLFIISAVL